MNAYAALRPNLRTRLGSALLSRRSLLMGSGAALAAVATQRAGRSWPLALAGQATPVATPTAAEVAFFVQFLHFEKFFASFGVSLSEEQLAGLYGLDLASYRRIRAEFDAHARNAAEELLTDADFAGRVNRLPFLPGDTVVGLGGSITDDLQSWLEMLRHLLALRRPADQIQVVNQGISDDTTTDALDRYSPILSTQPNWIICMLGTNDAMRHGRAATKTAVSLNETARNLDELRHLARAETSASWVWMTPPSCDEAAFAASPNAGPFETILKDADIVAIADVVRDQPEPVVDLVTLFGRPPATELMLAGQQAIVRALVERSTEDAASW